MLYKDYLLSLTSCPFCDVPERIILDSSTSYLTYALAPYHEDHLLVIPKGHKVSLVELNDQEKKDIESLIQSSMKMLRALGYKSFTSLVREGSDYGKSVSHLHYHVIPNTRIGDLDHNGEERCILPAAEVQKLETKLQEAVKAIA